MFLLIHMYTLRSTVHHMTIHWGKYNPLNSANMNCIAPASLTALRWQPRRKCKLQVPYLSRLILLGWTCLRFVPYVWPYLATVVYSIAWFEWSHSESSVLIPKFPTANFPSPPASLLFMWVFVTKGICWVRPRLDFVTWESAHQVMWSNTPSRSRVGGNGNADIIIWYNHLSSNDWLIVYCCMYVCTVCM